MSSNHDVNFSALGNPATAFFTVVFRGLLCLVVASARAVIVVSEGIAPREQQSNTVR